MMSDTELERLRASKEAIRRQTKKKSILLENIGKYVSSSGENSLNQDINNESDKKTNEDNLVEFKEIDKFTITSKDTLLEDKDSIENKEQKEKKELLLKHKQSTIINKSLLQKIFNFDKDKKDTISSFVPILPNQTNGVSTKEIKKIEPSQISPRKSKKEIRSPKSNKKSTIKINERQSRKISILKLNEDNENETNLKDQNKEAKIEAKLKERKESIRTVAVKQQVDNKLNESIKELENDKIINKKESEKIQNPIKTIKIESPFKSILSSPKKVNKKKSTISFIEPIEKETNEKSNINLLNNKEEDKNKYIVNIPFEDKDDDKDEEFYNVHLNPISKKSDIFKDYIIDFRKDPEKEISHFKKKSFISSKLINISNLMSTIDERKKKNSVEETKIYIKPVTDEEK